MSINLLEMFSSMYVPKVVIHSLIANLGNTLPAYVIGCWFYFASKSRKEENHQIVFLRIKYVGVQSWKAAHLPTLKIRVEQKGNCVNWPRCFQWTMRSGPHKKTFWISLNISKVPNAQFSKNGLERPWR